MGGMPPPAWGALCCPDSSSPRREGSGHPGSPVGQCGFHAFVFLSTPWVSPTVTCALARTASARIYPVPVSMPLAAPTFPDRDPLHSMRSVAACLGALLAPLRVLPVPLPFHAVRCPCSVSLRCLWPRGLAHAFSLAPCCVRPGLSPALVLGHSPCRIPSPAPRSPGRHSAAPARCPPPC